MNEIVLKKGTTVFLSEKGHNRFFYPTDKSDTLILDTLATRLYWVGSNDMIAFMIPETSIYANSESNKFISVWVQKSSLYNC